MDYGVTNSFGRLSDAALAELVETARALGVRAADTALGYGDAQVRLGAYADAFWVSTKVSAVGDVGAQVGTCLEQLRTTSVDAVLIHDWDAAEATARSAAIGALGECVDEGLVGMAGVSVYDRRGLDSALGAFDDGGVDLGIVQVPANALDRRLDDDEVLAGLAAAGCVVQVRSVFLQGVLADPSAPPFDAHPDVRAFWEWANGSPAGALAAALGHVRSLPWVGHVVVGATSAAELRSIALAWGEPAQRAPRELASADEHLIDPRTWRR